MLCGSYRPSGDSLHRRVGKACLCHGVDIIGEQFDLVIITIGALCWFRDLNRFFAVVAKCMKPGAAIVINEQHLEDIKRQ